MMARDGERRTRVRDALHSAGLDVMVCGTPSNVRMLTGYWPVVGTSVALCTSDGEVAVVVPPDEYELARSGSADIVQVARRDGLADLRRVSAQVYAGLQRVAADRRFRAATSIGCDRDGAFEPATYAAIWRFGASLATMVSAAFPAARVRPADDLLHRERAVLTTHEVATLLTACHAAATAFERGRDELEPGIREIDLAARFRAAFEHGAMTTEDARAIAFAWCMSGAHAADAGRTYARSRGTPIATGDLALVHCNAAIDGMWTDVTRTYAVGEPSAQQVRMYDAVFAARAAAMDRICTGVRAADVDAAARDVLREHGFGGNFTHGVGHGVGFGAIDHDALPRLRPGSPDVLDDNMVCNIEPAIYLPSDCGLRHCDMVRVTASGAELLTPFQSTRDELMAGAVRQGVLHA